MVLKKKQTCFDVGLKLFQLLLFFCVVSVVLDGFYVFLSLMVLLMLVSYFFFVLDFHVGSLC